MKLRKNRKRWVAKFLVIVMILTCVPICYHQETRAAIADLYWPVRNSNGTCITSLSSHNTWNGSSGHKGIDIKNATGCNWYAAYDGVVDKIFTGCRSNGNDISGHKGCSPNHGRYTQSNGHLYCNYGFGNGVVIKSNINGTNYYIQCAHMNNVASGLREGQSISKGTYLGTVGDRGFSFGTHAHFEIDSGKLFGSVVQNDPTRNGCVFSYNYGSVTPTQIPQGYLEPSNVYGGEGTIHIKGWAFDRDNVNAQLSIHVYIGGPAGTSGAERHIITANKLRTDVNAAFSNGVGNYHGFEDTIKTKKSGKQDIYVYAINIGVGNTNPELGHKAVTITPVNNPQGDLNINSVYGGKGTIHVRGWAFDKDNVNTHLTIHVYIGGPAGTPGAERHIITANKQRTDVPDVYPGVGNYHGYEETIVTKKSGSQGIYVYAMNIGSGNDNPLLGKETVAIEPVYKPQGWLETSNVRGGKKTVTLRGWAFDKDELNTQLNIRVYIGGDENSKAEKHIIKANKKRIDVYNKFPETGYYHGFEETIKVNSLGKQRIYVYADNVGGGTENLFLGSKEVTILDDVRSNPNVPKYKPMYIPSSSIKEIKKLKKVRGLSVKAKKRKITIKWKQVPNANGYQVQYATNKKFRQKKAKIAKKAKITLNKIKTRKIYYVKVRAYVRNGKDIVYGKWSKTKKKKLSN